MHFSPWRWWRQRRLNRAFWEALREKPPNLGAMQTFLRAGADVDYPEYGEGYTPLTFAVRREHCTAETVRFLLENGAKVERLTQRIKRRKWGAIPLTWALNGGGSEMKAKCRLIFEAGADVTASDTGENGEATRTVLWALTMGAGAELIEYALQRGANPNAGSSDKGWNPLHLAAHLARMDIVALYLQYGANPLARDKDGNTPRMLTEKGDNLIFYYGASKEPQRRKPDPRYENYPECVRLLRAAEDAQLKETQTDYAP